MGNTFKAITRLKTPNAARIKSVCSAHGEQWIDEYAWLKPSNWRDVLHDPSLLPDPIAEYIKAENDYHDQATAHLEPLKKELMAEMRGRMADKIQSLPVPDGPYQYQTRTNKNADYPVFVRSELNGSQEEVLLDIGVEANGHDYFDWSILDQSPDHKLVMWLSDSTGAEFFTLRFRDIALGADKDYEINDVDWAVWADSNTVFYTRLNSAHRVLTVYKHIVGTSPDNDKLVFQEPDERFGCSVTRSYSRRFIFIQVATFDQDEWWYIPIDDLDATPTLIQARQTELEYTVMDQRNHFVIQTNAGHATDWKIVKTPIGKPSMEHWVDLVPHQLGQNIVDIVVFEHWVVWLEVVNALGQIAYMNSAGTIKRIQFDEEAYSLGIAAHFGYTNESMLYYYSSPTRPWSTFQFDLPTSTSTRIESHCQIIPSGHDHKDYVTRRFTVESHDGVKVPVTLLYRRDTPIDGTAPGLLHGYGCYGSSTIANFCSDRLSLVDRGFIYAIAHVRGGQELGCSWHDDAKKEKKANSFHDFIAVGRSLISMGICAPNKIVSHGASAGGLLVTASMIMAPELFAGVIAEVPDVDVLNLMLDDTLPGVIAHWPEWGNPTESKTVFDAIKNYTPYENATAMNYPSLYVTAGVSDPRVFFWQPTKWVAKIRALKTDENIVLLKTNMLAGHFGQTGRFAHLDEIAQMYTFAIAVTTDC